MVFEFLDNFLTNNPKLTNILYGPSLMMNLIE